MAVDVVWVQATVSTAMSSSTATYKSWWQSEDDGLGGEAAVLVAMSSSTATCTPRRRSENDGLGGEVAARRFPTSGLPKKEGGGMMLQQ
jgi:hypothetical protein